MNTTTARRDPFSFAFALVAAWTALGAVPGFFDPRASFVRFHGHLPESPLVLDLYRGAWGQTLLFAIGYAFAARDPHRHALILLLGAIGKTLYAIRLLGPITAGLATPLTVFAALGDAACVTVIVYWLVTRGALRSLVVREEIVAAQRQRTGSS
ncbi:MAG: hypothetical protein JNK05_38275 [Myxococcales bacterium]|nr:hypothetical protein [Myxococcales bacterium]